MAQAAVRKASRHPVLSLDEFGELLGLIYCAAVEPDGWRRCLEAIRRRIRARTVTLFIRIAVEPDPGLMLTVARALPNGFKAGPSLAATGSLLTAVAPDRITTNQDLMPEIEWRASNFYREQCQPFGVFHFMGANIGLRNGAVYPFWAGRNEKDGPFSSDEQAIGTKLLPHLRRALELQCTLERDRSVQGLCGQALTDLMVGLVVLDAHGRVLDRNAVADGILRQQDGLRIVDGRLDAAYAPDRARLQHLLHRQLSAVRGAPAQGAISIGRPSGKIRWSVLAQPIAPGEWRGSGSDQPAIALFLRDVDGRSNPHAELVEGLFQLTRREALLAIHLANGLSVDEAARALGVQLTTARAHLRSMYSKIGVHRQTELVRLILNSVALLGSAGQSRLRPA
ncbi:MAG: hypothetical protein NAOJABEB_00019 [Steroidobacteraceae bacterium]|nr:hypothetical protein [Steroidobacteraceae bacterium]